MRGLAQLWKNIKFSQNKFVSHSTSFNNGMGVGLYISSLVHCKKDEKDETN